MWSGACLLQFVARCAEGAAPNADMLFHVEAGAVEDGTPHPLLQSNTWCFMQQGLLGPHLLNTRAYSCLRSTQLRR